MPSRFEFSGRCYFVKFAFTDRAFDIVTVHVGIVPTQAPLQLENESPGSGVATSGTAEPAT